MNETGKQLVADEIKARVARLLGEVERQQELLRMQADQLRGLRAQMRIVKLAAEAGERM